MGIDKVGGTAKAELNRNIDTLAKKPTKPVETAKPSGNGSKLAEAVFAGGMQKFVITAKALGAAKTAPAPKVDYFEIDKQADDLIKKHTDDGFFSDDLKTGDLGDELAKISRTDRERAVALADNILDKIPGNKKDDLSQDFVESLTPTELRELAQTEHGKELLGKMRGHMEEGWTTDNEDRAIDRIDNAVKAAEFVDSKEFKALPAETQNEIKSQFDANQGNKKATDNLIALAKSPEFAALPKESQKAVLDVFAKHKEDKIFTEGLITTAGKADFGKLTTDQQVKVLDDLSKLANTESYKGEGGFFGHNVSDADRRYLLDNIGGTSIFSAANPHEVAVRNTLDKIVNGDIRVETYSEEADKKTGGVTLGYTYSDDVIYMNMHPDASTGFGANQFTDTLVHEVNHNQNPGGKHGTPDQFLNEYRAFYVGIDAVGNPPNANRQIKIIDNLLGSYPKIKELYDNDPDFKKFIDDAKAGLGKTPPELLDPETIRQKLIDSGFSSDYVETPGNIDNH